MMLKEFTKMATNRPSGTSTIQLRPTPKTPFGFAVDSCAFLGPCSLRLELDAEGRMIGFRPQDELPRLEALEESFELDKIALDGSEEVKKRSGL